MSEEKLFERLDEIDDELEDLNIKIQDLQDEKDEIEEALAKYAHEELDEANREYERSV